MNFNDFSSHSLVAYQRAKAVLCKLSHHRSKYKQYKQLLLILLISSSCCSIPALAVPTVTINEPVNNSASQNATQSEDPQVAARPISPFINPNLNTDSQSNAQPTPTVMVPNPLNDPSTLASQMQPTDNALSQANQELLSRNAKLQRDVNDLETQVNVLVKERSGQLFMYGALTVAVAFSLGFFLSWLMLGRRDRW